MPKIAVANTDKKQSKNAVEKRASAIDARWSSQLDCVQFPPVLEGKVGMRFCFST
jgi:hypothetical protein